MSHGESGVPKAHVVSLKLLVGVWAALLVLTALTVTIAQFDFGELNIIVALAIAVIKGSLVVLYFMHMRWEQPFNGIVFVVSLAFLALLIGFTLLDSTMYRPNLIPGYAPAIHPQ